MSCTPSPCPPSIVPSPVVNPAWELPPNTTCIGGVFYNTRQEVTDVCVDSPTPSITVVVPAGSYTSTESQDDADAVALAAAQAEADGLREASPCVGGGEGSETLLLTEDEDFLTTEDGDFITTE